MKKFNIEQTEKDRILSLHESVKNKTLLNEQDVKVGTTRFNKALQTFLNKRLGANLKIDGNYGDATNAKIEEYQQLINDEILRQAETDRSKGYGLIRREFMGKFTDSTLDKMKTYMKKDYDSLNDIYKKLPSWSLF